MFLEKIAQCFVCNSLESLEYMYYFVREGNIVPLCVSCYKAMKETVTSTVPYPEFCLLISDSGCYVNPQRRVVD